ncbi:hypothetical protein [Cupriavidus pauculus]|nr:hypothetical protein [Cupriavidus pauculus]
MTIGEDLSPWMPLCLSAMKTSEIIVEGRNGRRSWRGARRHGLPI